jgi:hypothetical protein
MIGAKKLVRLCCERRFHLFLHFLHEPVYLSKLHESSGKVKELACQSEAGFKSFKIGIGPGF